jgi:two-component system, NtrC family, response regulator AtoC
MKLVVIDDDAMVLKTLEKALREYGFDSVVFRDPREGVEWIRRNGADIVLCDIRMPECDGFEVLRQVKELEPQSDFIFITAHSHVEVAIRALREGATDFFEKPFTIPALRAAIERTSRFRRLRLEKDLLSRQVHTLVDPDGAGPRGGLMIGQSPAMRQLAEQIADVAETSATVLILGESGTGKELTARAIHEAGPRREKLFLAVNCPSISEDLFESEMFGHRRGSFTGAVENRGGYVQAAEGGTLFLDEIGDLPLKSQAKLLRLVEEKSFMPVGEHAEKTADVRIVAATNQNLQALVESRRFREDLYYRLAVCEICQPPLRRRREDVPLLALYFALRFSQEMGKRIEGFADDALQALCAYDYPGNVRELRNIVESSVIRCRRAGTLGRGDLPEPFATRMLPNSGDATWPLEDLRFETVEKILYREALARADGNVSAAARLLGLSRGKLRRRLAELAPAR